MPVCVAACCSALSEEFKTGPATTDMVFSHWDRAGTKMLNHREIWEPRGRKQLNLEKKTEMRVSATPHRNPEAEAEAGVEAGFPGEDGQK